MIFLCNPTKFKHNMQLVPCLLSVVVVSCVHVATRNESSRKGTVDTMLRSHFLTLNASNNKQAPAVFKRTIQTIRACH